MNRSERRTGVPQKVFSGDHVCDVTALNRVKELDHFVRSAPCIECGGDTGIDEKDCLDCDEGTVPHHDFVGYKCPRCGRGWIQLQYVLRGTRYVSWRAVDDLGDQ